MMLWQKTIVSIISKDDLMPAYLFVKEKYVEGDGLMFISAKDTTEELALVSELLKVPSQDIVNVVLTKERDEFTYERIGRRLLPELRKDVKYCATLADEYLQKILLIAERENVIVHLMGELTFCFALLCRLKKHCITCVASTTKRIVCEEEPGKKIVTFQFVKFREY